MKHCIKRYYVVKIVVNYGDVNDNIDVGFADNYLEALLMMANYYKDIKDNIDDGWVIGDIQEIEKYRDDVHPFPMLTLAMLETWNLKTGCKIVTEREDASNEFCSNKVVTQ